MQRRVFIQLSAYTAAAITLPLVNGCHRKPINVESQPLFFSHLADVKMIADTGRAYLKANPHENNENKLSALLLANTSLSADADDGAIKTILAGKVSNDFKAGNTIIVSGWVLSVTEARQCALFSILQS